MSIEKGQWAIGFDDDDGPLGREQVWAVRNTPRDRALAGLWRQAKATRPDADEFVPVVTMWTAMQTVVAVFMAWAVYAATPTGDRNGLLAAALSFVLVLIVSKYVRAQVAVHAPQWSAGGLMPVSRERALTDRGGGGELSPQVWDALCRVLSLPRPGLRSDGLAQDVAEWIIARDRADYGARGAGGADGESPDVAASHVEASTRDAETSAGALRPHRRR